MPHEPQYIRQSTSKGYEVTGVRVGLTPEGPLPSGVWSGQVSASSTTLTGRKTAWADAALYLAKREGRNQIMSELNPSDGELSPTV